MTAFCNEVTDPPKTDATKRQTATTKTTARAKEGPLPDSSDDSSDEKLRQQVTRLIAELNSDSRTVRRRAEQTLLKLGPAVLPLLPPPELTPNAAVREAVRRIRVQLEQRLAQESVKASRVTLRGRLSLAGILAAITRQTGNRFETAPLADTLARQSLQVNYQHQTFWSVLADLSRRARLTFRSTPQGNALRPQLRSASAPPAEIAAETSTAFRLAVVSAEYRPLFGNRKERLFRVRWSLTAEPRLRPLFVKYSGRDLQAVADDGTVLSPLDPEARYEIPAGEGAGPLKLRSDFVIPRTLTISRFHLRGQLQVLTAAAQLPIVFRDLSRAKGAAKRRGGVTVTVQSVRFSPPAQKPAATDGKKQGRKSEPQQTVRVGISVSYDTGGPAFESHRLWIFHNRVFLRGERGRPILPLPGFSTVLQRDGAVAVVYRFSLPAGRREKLSFVYVAPTLLIRVPVTINLSGIPVSPPTKPSERRSK